MQGLPPPHRRVMRTFAWSILALFAILAFPSCDGHLDLQPPTDDEERPVDSDLPQYIPEAEFARIGLLPPEEMPAGATVDKR